jgi:predicted RNA binding protein YcfA (HicA-like mRNA interferase family)
MTIEGGPVQHLPAVKPKEAIRALERAGFLIHHISGSHYILKHTDHPGRRVTVRRVTVPFHNKDLKRKTLVSIIKQAGYTPEEFIASL